MQNLKNKLKNAFRTAQVAGYTAAGYAGSGLGLLAGDVPSAVFALDYTKMKADQARLKKQLGL
ncbi:MAG: hypothetical protein KGL10_07520 [Alphaproteobacteria bacterium]|nr:hypothetical protein [Alphaproteobacteria bacterium]MDE2337144.1 hypothetical protein [Alphaproteobacteria bacterium]